MDGTDSLTGWDVVEIAVSRGSEEPPHCRAELSPPAGIAPLTYRARTTFSDDDGQIASQSLTFEDGTAASATETTRTLAAPSREWAVLRVTDDQGLECVDAVEAVALAPSGNVPPRILSNGTGTASCGEAYSYGAEASFTGGGPAHLLVGCGCDQGGAALAGGAGVLLLALRLTSRRRRRT